jgi:SulP family sulfate permease
MPKIHDVYPSFVVPDMGLFVDRFPEILLASGAVMFVSYTSAIPVIRGFSKDLKGFDPNKEFFALGFAHVLIGFFGGYPVSGDDSRTAVNVAVGGRTKFVNLIAAFFILLTVLLIPEVLTALPLVTIAAIIASAGITMFVRGAGLTLFRSNKAEFLVFAVCVVGVLALGVYQGILFAILLAFFQLIKRSSKPDELELIYDHETGLLIEHPDYVGPRDEETFIYRFGSALLFYNVEYFVERITRRMESKSKLKLLVIDATPINIVDLTAAAVLQEMIKELQDGGIEVAFASANKSCISSISKELVNHEMNAEIFYPSIISVLNRK